MAQSDRITHNAVRIFNESNITGLAVLDPSDAEQVVRDYYSRKGMLSGMNPNYIVAVAKRMRSLVLAQAREVK